MNLFSIFFFLLPKFAFSQIPSSTQLIEEMSKHFQSKPIQIEQEVTLSQFPNLVIHEVWTFIHPLKVYLQVTLPTDPTLQLHWQYVDSSKIGPLASHRVSKANSGFITEALWQTTPSTTLLNLLETSGWYNLQVRLSKQHGHIAHHLYMEPSLEQFQGIWIKQQNAEPLRLKTLSQCDVQYENQNLKKTYQFHNQVAYAFITKSIPISLNSQIQNRQLLPQQLNFSFYNSDMDKFIKDVLIFYERCR